MCSFLVSLLALVLFEGVAACVYLFGLFSINHVLEEREKSHGKCEIGVVCIPRLESVTRLRCGESGRAGPLGALLSRSHSGASKGGAS